MNPISPRPITPTSPPASPTSPAETINPAPVGNGLALLQEGTCPSDPTPSPRPSTLDDNTATCMNAFRTFLTSQMQQGTIHRHQVYWKDNHLHSTPLRITDDTITGFDRLVALCRDNPEKNTSGESALFFQHIRTISRSPHLLQPSEILLFNAAVPITLRGHEIEVKKGGLLSMGCGTYQTIIVSLRHTVHAQLPI